MRFFDTAVADIDLAVTSGYPESKVFKLHERKAECLEGMQRPDAAAESYRVVRRISSLSVFRGFFRGNSDLSHYF